MTEVLALMTEAFGGRGGIAQYNRDFLTAVAKSGVVSTITALPRHALDSEPASSNVSQMPARAGRFHYSLAALWTALRRRPEIVFCGHLYMAPLAWIIAQLTNAQFVVQMHGVEAWSVPTRLRRAAVEAADLVLCVSRHTRSRVASWAAIAPERILVVPNTVGEAFTPGNGSGLAARLKLDGKCVLLTVGRLDPRERQKGHDRVIEAIPSLVARGHDVAYLIVGEGDDAARLEELTRCRGVADRVQFLGGLGADALPEAYQMADLFVMPSTQEGFGIVFLEAMACGTPTLGLDAGGVADALADGALGTLVPEDELAEGIARLLEAPKPDPHTFPQTVRTRFGREAFCKTVAMMLDRLLQPA